MYQGFFIIISMLKISEGSIWLARDFQNHANIRPSYALADIMLSDFLNRFDYSPICDRKIEILN